MKERNYPIRTCSANDGCNIIHRNLRPVFHDQRLLRNGDVPHHPVTETCAPPAFRSSGTRRRVSPREKFTLHENILFDILPVALIEIAVDPVDRSGRDHPNQRPVRLGNLCNGYANQFPILQPCDELRDIAAPEMSQPFRIEKFLIQIQKTPAGVIAALSEFFVIGGENLVSFRIQQKVGSLIFFIFDLLNNRLDQFVIAQFEPDQSLFLA